MITSTENQLPSAEQIDDAESNATNSEVKTALRAVKRCLQRFEPNELEKTLTSAALDVSRSSNTLDDIVAGLESARHYGDTRSRDAILMLLRHPRVVFALLLHADARIPDPSKIDFLALDELVKQLQSRVTEVL